MEGGDIRGTNAFQAANTGGATFLNGKTLDAEPSSVDTEQATKEETDAKTAEKADILIDVSRVAGQGRKSQQFMRVSSMRMLPSKELLSHNP
jgi:hypothetical protein